ncbi:MAG: hypothetical protein QNI84_15815 [Henriciella sp.]|nr:hypothetical protein [Henriciella sp.]
MSATARTPITRNLTLVALLVAAGVFSLRLFDVLQPAPATAPVGSQQEREVTALLETVTGPGQVKVAVHGGPEKSWLVLINGAPDSARIERIETILAASTGFRPGTDTLTVSEFEFATSARSQVPYQGALELTGLGLIVLILGGLSLRGAERSSAGAVQVLPAQTTSPRAAPDAAPPGLSQDTAIERAGALAEANPDGTVRLLRTWMSETPGAAS